MPRLPTLASVSCTVLHAAPQLLQLPHVTDLLTSFIDVSPLRSPAQAAASGSVRLLERVLSRYDAPGDPAMRSFCCAQALESAIQKNDLAMVQKIHSVHPEPLAVRSLSAAFKHGTWDMVQWVVSNRSDRLCCGPGLSNICDACFSGAMTRIGKKDAVYVVMWCNSQGRFDPSTANAITVLCTMTQCPELLDWFESCGVLRNYTATQIITCAFEGGKFAIAPLLLAMLARPSAFREDATFASLQCLAMMPGQEDQIERLLLEPKFNYLVDKVVFDAIRPGGRKVLQWNVPLMRVTRVDYVPMIQMVQSMAQRHGHIDTMEWLATECGLASFTPPPYSLQTAEEQLEVCSWLLSTGRGDWSLLPLDRAVQLGYLPLVKWYHTHRPGDFTQRTMDVAAGEGRLEILQWLHANRPEGCTQRAMDSAAFAGHLQIVQWLHENRTEGHTNFAIARAALGGRVDVVSWLYEHRGDVCVSCVIQFVLRYAHMMMGDTPLLHTLRWLDAHVTRREGCNGTCCTLPRSRLTRGVPEMALNLGDVALLAYLNEHHSECIASWPRQPDRIARLLIERGHLGCVQWMYTHRRDDCNWQAVRAHAVRLKLGAITAWLDTTL